MLDQLDPGLPGGDDERAAEVAVFDLMVARAPDGGGDTGLQMRFASACLRCGQPMQIEAEAFWNS